MYATIQNRKVEIFDGVPTLKQAQEIVGGLVETILRIPTDRPGINVEIYGNEEGLLLGLPIQYTRGTDGSYLAGNFVIIGGDENKGEWTGLTTEEIGLAFDWLNETAEDIDPADLGW